MGAVSGGNYSRIKALRWLRRARRSRLAQACYHAPPMPRSPQNQGGVAPKTTAFEVPGGKYFWGWLFDRGARFWRGAGNFESAVLRDYLDDVPIDRPIYVGGMARSGSTVITEMISQHPAVTCHHYSDFPAVYIPFWWNWLRARMPLPEVEPEERAHRDRLEVTPDSPEAIEEVLWMHYLDGLHDRRKSNVLDASASHADFEKFYRDHIRKLLLVRERSRYVTKGNYNSSRVAYIHKLFPDAKFIIPVRHPIQHIASSMKQDRLFSEGQEKSPRTREYLSWVGHFEFGVDKAAINLGDAALAEEIGSLWDSDRPARGWGLYWSSLYGYLLDAMADSEALRKAALFVKYEDLCESTPEVIDNIIRHCELDPEAFAETRSFFIDHLTAPTYYTSGFSDHELEDIRETTRDVAARLGYEL